MTDVFVTGGTGTWVDRGGGAQPEPRVHLSEAAVRDLAVRLVARGGRHVDEASPCVDVRLPGGVRVHVVLPPISTSGTALSIRFPRAVPPTLDDLSRADQQPSTKVLVNEVITPSPEVAHLLGIAEEGQVLHLERVRFARGEPIARMRNYLPAGLIEPTSEQLEERGLYQLLRSAGVQLHAAQQAHQPHPVDVHLVVVADDGVPQDLHRRQQQHQAEDQEDPVEGRQRRRTEGDEDGPEQQRADDAVQQDPLLCRCRGTANAPRMRMKTKRLSTESDFSTR